MFNVWPFKKKQEDIEQKSSTSDSGDTFFSSLYTSSSGVEVSAYTSFQASVVVACASVIANGISQIPFVLYKRDGKKNAIATDNSIHRLLQDGGNPYMSGFEFREAIALHLALWGNSYVWLNKVRGKVVEMFPIHPDRVSSYVDPDGDGWKKKYFVTLNEKKSFEIPDSDIWHLRWRMVENLQGCEPIRMAKNAIGITLATDNYLGSSLKDGIRPSGILSVNSNMTAEQQKDFRKSFQEQYSGSANSNKTMVLSGDISFSQMSQTNEDAQLLENREFQVSEICRFWGVMPIMVYSYLKGMSYSSSEQLFLQHVVHTLDPWYTRIESSANKNLLTYDERHEQGYQFKFLDEDLLRGDSKSRADIQQKRIFAGVTTPNEERAWNDLNPLPGGDELFMQSAMTTVAQIVKGNNLSSTNQNTENTETPNNGDSENSEELEDENGN